MKRRKGSGVNVVKVVTRVDLDDIVKEMIMADGVNVVTGTTLVEVVSRLELVNVGQGVNVVNRV